VTNPANLCGLSTSAVTDGGQAINPPPTETYRLFIEGLLRNWFTEDEIVALAHTTPARVLLDRVRGR
jgi:hypothetical protein